jgi:hypothetical protein
MRVNKRYRLLTRALGYLPLVVDLLWLAERDRYVGSPEHKDIPSLAGQPKPRADATICDQSFIDKLPQLNSWLRSALTRGAVGAPWEGDFPRYVWFKESCDPFSRNLVSTKGMRGKGRRGL